MTAQKVPLTIEQLVKIHLKRSHNDPMFHQQYPNFFFNTHTGLKAQHSRPPTVSTQAKRFLTCKKLPTTHYVESTFAPYLKASKHTKSRLSQKRAEGYDLADIKHQEFRDNDVSVNEMIKSQSPVKASRLPTSPLSKSLERSIEFVNLVQTEGIQKRIKNSPLKVCKSIRSCKSQTRSPAARSPTLRSNDLWTFNRIKLALN
jgi:hypothetical protein